MLDDQLEEVYIKYNRELYLYGFVLCKDHHLAQDLASDTFVKAYLSLEEGIYIKYWLFRVCKNLYLDYLKRNREYSSKNIIEANRCDLKTPLDKIIESEEN